MAWVLKRKRDNNDKVRKEDVKKQIRDENTT